MLSTIIKDFLRSNDGLVITSKFILLALVMINLFFGL